VGFDPQLLQVVNVQEGEFLKQSGGKTTFSHRVDAAQGRVFVAAVRQAASPADTGINGSGQAIVVSFKALKPATATPVAARVQLLSVSPEPGATAPIALPVEKVVQVLP